MELCVDVIISTYNRKKLLKEAIESVLNQTYRNFNIIVSDDGSTDKTDEMMEKEYKHKDNIIYLKHENVKQSLSRNMAFEYCSCPLVAFLDDDDKWDKQYLEKVISALEKDRNAIGVITNRTEVYIDGKTSIRYEKNKPDNSRIDLKWILKEGSIISPSNTVVFRKYILKAGLFRDFFVGAEDFDLLVRILNFGYLIFLDEPLVLKRERGYSLSTPLNEWRAEALSLEDFVNRNTNELEPDIRSIALESLVKNYNRYAKGLLYYGENKKAGIYMKKALEISKIINKKPSLKNRIRYCSSFLPYPASKFVSGMYFRQLKENFINKRTHNRGG